jgi:hypothetical protein
MYNEVIQQHNNKEELGMKKSFRTMSISLFIVLVLLLLSVSAALASPPLAIHIEVYEEIAGGPDDFTASGPAVGAGAVCPTGKVADLYFYNYKPSNQKYDYLFIEKQFTCAGTFETFNITMKVKLNRLTGDTTAKWEFAGGTGPYTSLSGHGKLVGVPDPNNSGFIWDYYDGKVH